MSKKQKRKESISQRMNRRSEIGYNSGGILSSNADHLLFDVTGRLLTLRFVSFISLLCPAITILLVTRLSQAQMIEDLGSVAWGRLLQIGLILLSCIFFFTMLWLSNKYVLRMELKGGNIHLLTWRVLLPNKNYILAPNVFSTNVEFNEGHLELPLKLIVNAPYYTLRTAAQKFIIDEQGDFPLGVDVMLEAIHHS